MKLARGHAPAQSSRARLGDSNGLLRGTTAFVSERDPDELTEAEGGPDAGGAREAQERRDVAEGAATSDSPTLPPPILDSDDDVPRQPAPPLDPYTPEPGPRPGERRAWQVMRLALIPIAIAVAIVIWAALR